MIAWRHPRCRDLDHQLLDRLEMFWQRKSIDVKWPESALPSLVERAAIRKLWIGASDIWRIDTFPDMAGFTSLRELTIGWFSLDRIPEQVFQISTLRQLTILNCPITCVTDRIARLRDLRRLVIRGGELKHVPNSILELRKLEYLDLANNQIARVDESILELKHLRYIGLHANWNCVVDDRVRARKSLRLFEPQQIPAQFAG